MEESKGRLSLVIMRTMLQKVRGAQRRELIIRLEYSRPTSSRGISLINGHGTNFWRCGPRTGDRTFRVTFLQVWFITARDFYVRMRIISFLIMVYPFGGVEVWDIIVHLARVREKERERERGNKEQGYRLCESRATFFVLRRNWFTWTGSQLLSSYYERG